MNANPTPSGVGSAPSSAANSVAETGDLDVKEFYAGQVTPVCIVTAYAADGAPHATTIGSYCAVSLAPPIVLFCLLPDSQLLAHLGTGSSLRIHFASARDGALVTAFATKGGPRKFDGVEWRQDVEAPTLPGLNHVCGKVFDMVDIGDHVVVYVAVSNCSSPVSDSAPLLYHRRSFGRFERNESWPSPKK